MEPVSLEEVKPQLRIDIDDDSYDGVLNPLIKAAREWCEEYQNRAYITQTFELALDEWPHCHTILLPRPNLQSIESVQYVEAGNMVTWGAANFYIDTFAEPGFLIASGSWPDSSLPRVNGIIVTYKAGYGDSSDTVPQRIKQAITLLVCHWFENGMCDPPPAVMSLLNLDRVVPV